MIGGVCRVLRWAPAVAVVLAFGCGNPEAFHKNSDAGFVVTGSGGSILGTGGGTPFGTGGGTPFGSGGGIPFGSGGSTVGTGGMGTGGRGTGGAGTGGATGGSGTGGAATGGSGTGGRGTGGAASGGAGVAGAGTGGAATGGRGPGGAGGMGGSMASGGSGTGGMEMMCATCMLSVTYIPVGAADGQATESEVRVSTNMAVAVNRITIKYWFTNDTGNPSVTTDVDYVGLSTGAPLTKPAATGATTAAVTPPRTGADMVSSITLPDTLMLVPGTYMIIKFRIHATDFRGVMMRANDYSFGATQTLAMPWMHITAYVGGVRAWGNEPP